MSAISRRDEMICNDLIARLTQLMIGIKRANNEGLYVKIGIGIDGATLDIWRSWDNSTVCVDTDHAICIHQGPI